MKKSEDLIKIREKIRTESGNRKKSGKEEHHIIFDK